MLGAGNADRHRRVRQQGQDNARSEFAMLSVPTLWTVITINFLALALIWVNIMRSYPKFDAARFWTGAAVAAAAGARAFDDARRGGFAMAADRRRHPDDFGLLPCRDGHQALLRQAGLMARHDPDRELSCAGLGYFMVVQDNMLARILIYSLGQSIPIAMTLKLVLPRRGHKNPGARLVGITAIADSRHPCRSLRLRAAAGRRRRLDDPVSMDCRRP